MMKKSSAKAVKRKGAMLAAAACITLGGSAQAAPFTASQTQSNFSGLYAQNPFTMNFATPTDAFGDATLTLTLFGDFDMVDEYLNVMVEGLNLGNIFDNNPGNDAFDLVSDVGCQYNGVFGPCSAISTSATILFADLKPRIADGLLSITFDPSATVNNLTGNSQEFVSATLSFNRAVPEPGSLALVGLGITGLIGARKRRY